MCEMYDTSDNLILFLTILIIFRVMLFMQKRVVESSSKVRQTMREYITRSQLQTPH